MFMIQITVFLLLISLLFFFKRKFGNKASSYISITIIASIILLIVFTGNVDDVSRFVILFGIIGITFMISNLKKAKSN
ncbi:hypothetical protein CEH05_07570 [Halobacillus halophilus]|uniref:hypothetical protein n=1 Tax=Halobacillus halophilus TaxID=1570 RepID=UPI0002D7869B|nr:hypothetical protein [Halobacillus halophilus]ASF38977.1 hypothetical protein CEH05_07570 [Halobacillus halophilus]